jgi:NTP pyrophosphatase (non-canonical NTP hydrolase)
MKIDMNNLLENVRAWGESKNISGANAKATPGTQFSKLKEEVGELELGLWWDDQVEVEDAIGDCVVVLTLLAELRGTTLEKCLEGAYNVISKRTGEMVNGQFVKDK